MNSTSQDSGTSLQSSNIYIYTALTVLSIAVIYILYKQTTSNQASDNAIKAAAAAAATSATQNAGYETQSDLNTLIKSTGNNTVTVPATAGLFSYMPVYGYYKATGTSTNNAITWAPYTDPKSTQYSNGITLSNSNSMVTPNYNGLYEIIVSGEYISTAYNNTPASLFLNCNNVVRYRVWYNSFSQSSKYAYPCSFTALYRQTGGDFSGFSIDTYGMDNVTWEANGLYLIVKYISQ